MGGKVQRISSIDDRWKTDRGRYRKWRSQRTYMYDPWTLIKVGGARQREIKGRKKWDNYNSIINKIYLKIIPCLPKARQACFQTLGLQLWTP